MPVILHLRFTLLEYYYILYLLLKLKQYSLCILEPTVALLKTMNSKHIALLRFVHRYELKNIYHTHIK